MDIKQAKLIVEKLKAMEAFCVDTRAFITGLMETPSEEAVVTPVVEKAPKAKQEVKETVVAEETVTEEVQEEEVAEENSIETIIAEYELLDMEIADLKEYLDSYKITYNKYKKTKQYFAETVAENILNGTIPSEEDEPAEEQETTTSVVEEVAEEATEEVIDESQTVEEVAEEEATDIPAERLETEQAVEAKIRADFESKKLKPSGIKTFLKKYYNGDPDCADCKGCSQDETLDCYIEIQTSLVDDEGTQNDMSNPYVRNDENYCCGKPLVEHPDDENILVCEICGVNYEV